MKNKNYQNLYQASFLFLTAAGLLISYSGYAVTIVETDNTVTQLIVEPEVLKGYDFDFRQRPKSEHVLTFYGDGAGFPTVWVCPYNDSSPKPARHLPGDRTRVEWTQFTNYMSNAIKNCPSWRLTKGSGKIREANRISLHVSDGHQFDGQNYDGIATLNLVSPNWNGDPTSCDAHVLSHMSFGKVRPGPASSVTADGEIEITCNAATTVNVQVNNGRPLETIEGASVSFTYENAYAISKELPHSISIDGTLNKGPSTPGEYRWYVPIVIKYE
ncbi:hypothetical protein GTW15_01850 [Vibrio cholerae]|nr:hypothetical protein [Vibrio cholerae]